MAAKRGRAAVKSVFLRLVVPEGMQLTVKPDPRHPYTVAYDKSTKRVLHVFGKGTPTFTLPRDIETRTLLLVGSVDEKAWRESKVILDNGGDPAGPGTATNGSGRLG
jgi:hypothetical protein